MVCSPKFSADWLGFRLFFSFRLRIQQSAGSNPLCSLSALRSRRSFTWAALPRVGTGQESLPLRELAASPAFDGRMAAAACSCASASRTSLPSVDRNRWAPKAGRYARGLPPPAKAARVIDTRWCSIEFITRNPVSALLRDKSTTSTKGAAGGAAFKFSSLRTKWNAIPGISGICSLAIWWARWRR